MSRRGLYLFAALTIFPVLATLSHASTEISSYSVFATNSVWVRQNATVNSGNIGVEDASAGPWLDSQSEVTIGLSAYLADGVSVYGDTVKMKTGASVFDVYYNQLDNNGTVRGQPTPPCHFLWAWPCRDSRLQRRELRITSYP